MKKVLINVEERELRVAILEDEQLVELYIESLDEKSILNNIYKGRVEDILPGLKAAFVNIGIDRNAFLHFDDVRPDLIWAKYREMHPEMAEDVPTAREALAEPVEVSSEEGTDDTDSAENGDSRKRRRGRRGGKKRRPDSEDSYSPGLPVGVTEDDLEDDDDDESESSHPPVAARSYERPPPGPYVSPAKLAAQEAANLQAMHAEAEASTDEPSAPVEAAGEVSDHDDHQADHQSPESESRRLARQERQKQRRERWEQKKLERQQRRQQERMGYAPGEGSAEGAETAAAGSAEHAPAHQQATDSGNRSVPRDRNNDRGDRNDRRPDRFRQQDQDMDQEPYEEPMAPAAYGTRGAAYAYDNYSSHMTPNQRRQNKARYGESFGNVAITNKQRHDHRDSQNDFFGPNVQAQDDQHSIWDDRQPNLGPVPGLGKAFLDIDTGNRRDRRRGPERRPDGNSNSLQGQTRNPNNKRPAGGKRRGGKKRTMRKRDNRSFFAFSADDIDKDIPATPVETGAAEPEKKVTRRRKPATTDADGAAEAKPARKTAVKKTTTAKAPRKAKTAAPAEELPLDIPTSDVSVTDIEATESAPAKPVASRKPASPRAKKSTAKAKPATADMIDSTTESPADKPAAVASGAAEPVQPEHIPAGDSAKDVVGVEAPSPTPDKEVDPQPAAAIEAPASPAAPAPAAANIETTHQEEPSKTATSTPEVPGNAVHVSADSTEPVTPGPASAPVEGSADASPDSIASASSEQNGNGSGAHGDERPNGRRRRNSRLSRAERAARHRQRDAEAAATAGQGDQSQPAAEVTEAGEASPEQVSSTPEAAVPAVSTPAPAKHGNGRQDRHGGRGRDSDSQGGQGRRDKRHIRKPLFQEVFRKGDEIMVQVVKEEIGMKGARISSYVSLPGRYLVLLPYPNQEGGISRKVEDIKERKRLKNLLQDISSDETAFIVRTAGVYQEEKEIRNDVEFLSHEWQTIASNFEKSEPKSLVYDDHDILYRLARDVFDESFTEILIDSHMEAEKLKSILGKLIPGLVDKVKVYSGSENIFHKFGVTKQIQKAARRKVWLKSGGYLIIDEAEALTAIDVNTGKSVGKDDQEKLILRTNLEAARAVARELKLRDIGGLIVIDFIDMKDARNKEQVLHELKLQLRKDRSKTSVSAISEFGLVEMTRKRVRRSLRKTIFMDCPYCQGAGAVLNEQQIWLHIKHEIVRQLESSKPSPTLNITVNPKIRAYVDQNYREVMRRLEQKYDTEIRISMSDIFHIENYQIEKLESTGVISGSATMPGR